MPANESSEPVYIATAASSGPAVVQVRLHPCLQVPELVDIIFRCLGEHPFYGPRSLSCLARTCRWFLEPALDVLWSNLPSVGPLIRALPADAWSVEKNTPRARHTVRLLRPPEAHEWPVLLRYAARIRGLGLNSAKFAPPYYVVPSSVYAILDSCKPIDHLFPNLKHIEWHFDPQEPVGSLLHLDILLGPKVEYISIIPYHSMPEASSALLVERLKAFILSHHVLRHLLVYCPHNTDYAPLIPDVIAANKSIQTLEIVQQTSQSLPRSTWLELARLPKLEKTIIAADEFLGSEQERNELRALEEPTFVSLRYATIHAQDLAGISRCLDFIHSSSLERLNVFVTITPTNQEAKALFTKLMMHPSHGALRQFYFHSALGSPRDDTDYILTADTLRVLLAAKDVSAFGLGFRCPVSIDDAFLSEVAAAWGDTLESLDLGTGWRRRPAAPPRVTLSGIFALLQRCERLAHLGVEFSPDVQPFREAYMAGTRPCRGLRTGLTTFAAGASLLGALTDSAVIMLAGILSDLLPAGRTLSSQWDRAEAQRADEDPEDPEERQRWQEVKELFEEMRTIRMQERLWPAIRSGA